MSFHQSSSLEAGRRVSLGTYTDDPEFQRQYQELTNDLIRLNNNNARISGEIGHLGTRRDTPRVREGLHNLLEESRGLFKDVGQGVKKMQTWDDVTPTQRYRQQKLSRDFQASLAEFQSLQRQALDKEKASVTAARAAVDPETVNAGEDVALQQQQLQEQGFSRLAPQDEVDFQESLIIEREEEIRNIEQGVGDLNVLMRQVAQIVTEQGEQLDNIADVVDDVYVNTHGADRELTSAAKYQKNARSKACCLLLVLAIIFTIVLLAIFVE